MDIAASSERFAQRFLDGEHDAVLDSLREAGAELSRETASRIAGDLRSDARSHWNVWPRGRTWADHQRAVLDLAQLPGVDVRGLAEGLIDACLWQRIDGYGSPLEPATFEWMMDVAPDHIHDVLRDHPPYAIGTPSASRFLLSGLWTWPDGAALDWMLDWYRRQPGFAKSQYREMRLGHFRSSWSPEEWNRRVHALCDARLGEAPLYVDTALSPATSAAQVRLACTHASSVADHLLRTVAANVRSYRSGDPATDLDLIFWDVPEAELELLRGLLELTGDAGTRTSLVEAAADAGRIDARRARLLNAPMERPAWMDGPVPWEVQEVVDAGVVRLPDGELSAADPYWAFEGVPFELEVPPGSYPVRIAVAAHPLVGRGCAVAELVLAEEPATHWERLGERPRPNEFGYRVEVGVGSFGPVVALTERFHDCDPPDAGRVMLHTQVDAGEDGSIVMFSVLPQHQLCRTWLGRSADGTPTRVLSDLGLIHVNPESNPHAPMTPSEPPPEPVHEHITHPLEAKTGVHRGKRYRSVDDAVSETVTVLDIAAGDDSWLHADAVWFRWDLRRVGDVLPASDFHARFTPV